MATVVLSEKFSPLVDEKFAAESKKSLLTNQNFNWIGAYAINVYKVGTSGMNDYNRSDSNAENWSRFGKVEGLDATTQKMMLTKDRSFTFAIDKLDSDETQAALQAASALERQVREVVIPEVDTKIFNDSQAGEYFRTVISNGVIAVSLVLHAVNKVRLMKAEKARA